MKYTALPTWLMTILFLPFVSATHPWKHRRFTLSKWAAGRTLLCKQLDIACWIIVFNIVFVLWVF